MRSRHRAAGTNTPDNPDQRFRRHSRLLEKHAFRRVFSGARRSRDKLFTVLYSVNEQDGSRLGLAISKKHCRLATGRNRLKRIVRESFRKEQAALHGLDVVVLNQPAATRADNKALFDSLAKHWQRCSADVRKKAEKN